MRRILREGSGRKFNAPKHKPEELALMLVESLLDIRPGGKNFEISFKHGTANGIEVGPWKLTVKSQGN